MATNVSLVRLQRREKRDAVMMEAAQHSSSIYRFQNPERAHQSLHWRVLQEQNISQEVATFFGIGSA